MVEGKGDDNGGELEIGVCGEGQDWRDWEEEFRECEVDVEVGACLCWSGEASYCLSGSNDQSF